MSKKDMLSFELPDFSFSDKKAVALLGVLVLLLGVNQVMIFQAESALGDVVKTQKSKSFSLNFLGLGSGGTASAELQKIGIKDGKTTISPAFTDSPVLEGYRTKVQSFPTISEIELKEPTGDIVQDLLNNLTPAGTPFYGDEAKVSFDDPITSQNNWLTYEHSITLSGADKERYDEIVSKFTCDYCCGSPQNPTVITRCGCKHAKAWRGMATYFIANMGSEVTDDEIIGEMSRWKALWYPGPTIKRVVAELEASGEGSISEGSSSNIAAAELPSMVGGC